MRHAPVSMKFEDAELGPKMQACSDRERLFVWHYLQLGGVQCGAQAARLAGYSGNGETAKTRAHELLHRERVIAALDEVGRKAFRGLMIPAVAAAGALIADRKAAGHVKAVLSTLSRLGIVERSGVDVAVTGEIKLSHTDEAVETLRVLKELRVPREKLVEMYGYSGLERYEGMLRDRGRPKLIEGEAREVSRETSGDEGDDGD